jgi:hypothetical protein
MIKIDDRPLTLTINDRPLTLEGGMRQNDSNDNGNSLGSGAAGVMPRYTFEGPTVPFCGYWITDEWMNELVARADNHIIAERICRLLNEEQESAA